MSPKRSVPRFVVLIFTGACLCSIRLAQLYASDESAAVMSPVGLKEAHWTGGFWRQRFETCRNGTLPALSRIMHGTERSQFLQNFRIAAGLAAGRHRGPDWNDGDTYKWLEALAAAYAQTGDVDLDRELDEAIAVIEQAQRPDGYIHTPVLISARELAAGASKASAGEAVPFHNPQQFEMYNFGHLCTAASVHFQATGKRSLLDVAIRAADFLDRSFAKPNAELARHAVCPSHYMGLIDLYRVTGDQRYLALVERWLAMRDLVAAAGGGDDNQDRLPFREQTEAVGHAVRANYLYAGVADLYLETGDATLLPPLLSLWKSVAQRKMYITGGCGALYDGASPDGSVKQRQITRVHQAYGRNYQLPNSTAHNETCATVGNVLWNGRMLQATGDARYADVIETAFYNAALAGVSLDGERFFYTNTLRQLDVMPTELRWSRERQPFVSSFCCPPNVVRLIAEANCYAYGRSHRKIWVHLFGTNSLETELAQGQVVRLVQKTEYPWDGRIVLTVEATPSDPWSVAVRIPGWVRAAKLTVNGVDTTASPQPGTYVAIERRWTAGDCIELDLAMPPRLVQANPLVEENRNHVAVQRGPVIYCLESIDVPPGIAVPQVRIPRVTQWETRFDETLLGGVTVLEGTAVAVAEAAWTDELYRDLGPQEFHRVRVKFVPYFVWGNRGPSEMTVWLPLASE